MIVQLELLNCLLKKKTNQTIHLKNNEVLL